MFAPKAPASERRFTRSVVALAKHREREGREKFGYEYLEHDGLAEAADEIADFIVYLYLLSLRTAREGGDEDGIEVLLQASKEAIGALEKAMTYPAKRRGTP